MPVHGDGVLVGPEGSQAHVSERVAVALEVEHGRAGGQVPADAVAVGAGGKQKVVCVGVDHALDLPSRALQVTAMVHLVEGSVPQR